MSTFSALTEKKKKRKKAKTDLKLNMDTESARPQIFSAYHLTTFWQQRNPRTQLGFIWETYNFHPREQVWCLSSGRMEKKINYIEWIAFRCRFVICRGKHSLQPRKQFLESIPTRNSSTFCTLIENRVCCLCLTGSQEVNTGSLCRCSSKVFMFISKACFLPQTVEYGFGN